MKYSDILIPNWCGYPEPTCGIMGCWSLVTGMVNGLCNTCDYFKAGEYTFSHIAKIMKNQQDVKKFLESKQSHEGERMIKGKLCLYIMFSDLADKTARRGNYTEATKYTRWASAISKS